MKKRSPAHIGSSESGVHLWLLLWKATKVVEAGARRSVRETGLCLSDFGVLEALLHKGPLPVSALGRKVLLTSGSITVAVDRLERRALVERTFSKKDRRTRIVRLTAGGAKLTRMVFAEHAQDMERMFACLDGGQRKALANLLRQLGRAAHNLGAGRNDEIGVKQQRRRRT